MSEGKVTNICISAVARAPMQKALRVRAVAGYGLVGDRYATGDGSYNKEAVGKRQVTLINGLFVPDSGFLFEETRRNLEVVGIELMDLIGKEFDVGSARFKGVKYCDPCLVPSVLAGKKLPFRDAFHDRGGLVAEVIVSGWIEIGSLVVPPKKPY